jgi:hypothetical protein
LFSCRIWIQVSRVLRLEVLSTTPSVPKYKHLLTFSSHISPFVLFKKNYEKIIYFVMTCFIIVYILSIS